MRKGKAIITEKAGKKLYKYCHISDDSGFEISDANGEVVCCFGSVSNSPSDGAWDPVRYRVDPDDELEVVYDGILTDIEGTPFNSDNCFGNYVAKGDTMNYSDIRIGDIVDVVYYFSLDDLPLENRKYTCCAINVHKR